MSNVFSLSGLAATPTSSTKNEDGSVTFGGYNVEITGTDF